MLRVLPQSCHGLKEDYVVYTKMAAVKKVCDENEVSYPAEIKKYFYELGDKKPFFSHGIPCNLYREGNQIGYDVPVAAIPNDIVIVRFQTREHKLPPQSYVITKRDGTKEEVIF